MIVRGVSLDTVLKGAPAPQVPALEDTAILRFKNGTRVQVPLNEASKYDVFLVTAVRMSEQGEWTKELEPVPLGTAHWASARSLVFAGHRTLVGKPDAPRGAGTFSPWGFVDSLVEVELVNAAAWRKVFAIGATDVEDKGLTVFENRCQACHGARGAGSRLGWDFVEPLPVTTWRTPESLYDHVRAHKLADAELGLLMPPQPDITKEEIGALHAWMKRLSEKKLSDYKP
jgi:mono/diheme cytochrome c family protein